MTNYYKQKIDAFQIIDQMVSDGVPIENIYFKIETMFGFSKKIVDERMDRLEHVSKTSKINKDGK